MDHESQSSTVSYQHIFSLFQQLRTELTATIERMTGDVERRLEKMATEFEVKLQTHLVEHRQERDYKSGLTRWAVTALLSGGGVAITAWLGLTDKI